MVSPRGPYTRISHFPEPWHYLPALGAENRVLQVILATKCQCQQSKGKNGSCEMPPMASHRTCRVEHWRVQPKVGSFRSPLFRLWSGCLIQPSPTFPAAPPQMPYGGFSPVRLQAQVPRSSIRSLPTRHVALKSDPRHSRGIPCVCCSLWNGRPPARLPASVCGPLAKLVPPEPRGP